MTKKKSRRKPQQAQKPLRITQETQTVLDELELLMSSYHRIAGAWTPVTSAMHRAAARLRVLDPGA
jgi:hypothetical protein